ncbi:MAG: hypothetical protein E4H14_11190, partial [Candidatus Thorarchaeota archaeon]
NNDTHVSIHIEDVSVYFEIRNCLFISTPPTKNVGGVEIYNVPHGHIEDCEIVYKNAGLQIRDSIGLSVVNCTMNYNAAAATVEWSNYTSFSGCYFTNTTTGSGFYQDNSHWTSITDSYLIANIDYGAESFDSDFFTFNGNDVRGNGIAGLYVITSDSGRFESNTVYENGDEGFQLIDSNQITIMDNTICDNGRYGLVLVGPEYVYVSYNIIYNNTLDGINYDTGGNSVLEANTIYNNGWEILGMGGSASGISLSLTENISVIVNEVYNNTRHGIILEEAVNCTIYGNTVWGNYGIIAECGIFAINSNYCNITSNLVYNNTDNGIFLQYSDDCIVTHNIVYDNSVYGLALDQCNRTLIYYNDFGWNPTNAYSSVDSTDINYWDNGAIGNWWSDFDGTIPYNVSGPSNEQDMHPSNSLVLGTVSDLENELGSTGNTLFLSAQALNPGHYEVVEDTTLIGTTEWNGDNIYADIDGLDVGTYTITVRAFHISGHYLTQSATVTVVDTTAPEWVITPTNQTVHYGDALIYEIQVTDFSNIEEWIISDMVNFSIVDGLLTNNTTLELGYYRLNITVVDAYGNARSAVITIHVITIDAPTVDMTGFLLIVGGAGAALLTIVVVVIIMKKKSG